MLAQLQCNCCAVQGDPQVNVGVAGDANVTVSFEGRFAGGFALNKRTFMTATAGRPPRQFQVYAQVDSVAPSTGSLAGGTLVTLKGRGFPTSAAVGSSSAVSTLRVGGMACQVVSSNFSTITCTTVAEVPAPTAGATAWCRWNSTGSSSNNATTSNSTDSNTTTTTSSSSTQPVCWDGSIKGLNPGMRGVLYEFFNR